ncbi:alpha/beta hydrolase family protein [Archangium lansingense]|uniref:alpha/beta hydrolase family protein n=1 Tax=Archangium lansingense TaxID=2995310 RepID=UPI003B7E84EA
MERYARADIETSRARIPELKDIPPIEHGVECLEVTYETVDLEERPTLASGLVCLPIDGKEAVPLISYQHGTEVADSAVPTGGDSDFTAFMALFFSGGGYAVCASDYLGLGASERTGIHPYLHATSEASASIDMIRAAHHIARAMNIPLSDQLYLTGYSQGGHATMALLKELQARHAEELPVRAAIPMGGPYDLSQTSLDAVLRQPQLASSLYLAYLILGYDRVYDLFASPSDVFRDGPLVERLFDRTHGFEELLEKLPATPEALLNPEYFAALRDDPSHPLRRATRENDLYDWRPNAPVRLCHGEADLDVPFQNAVIAEQRMKELGADIAIVNVGPLAHQNAVTPCHLEARRWFDTLEPRAAGER